MLLNDNVFQNIEGMNFRWKYSETSRFGKSELTDSEIQEDIKELVEEPIENQTKRLHRSIDKILI